MIEIIDKKSIIILFRNTWHLLSKFYPIALIIIILFSIGIFIGYSQPSETQKSVINTLKSQFADIINSPDFEMFLRIFFNNTIASLIIILLGFTILLPLLVTFFNGWVFGIAVGFTITSNDGIKNPIVAIFLATIPHGIIELPAILLSSFLAVLLGLKFFFKQKIIPKKSFKIFFKEILKIYILIIIPLLLIAAFVEVFITKSLFL